MPHTFTKLSVHLVFSTKGRERFLKKDLLDRLFPYMARILDTEFGLTREIGGTEDHVHVLAEIRRDVPVAELMRDLKSRSSGWMHRDVNLPEFRWQEGYGAFSVSHSALAKVADYVRRQEEHHRKGSFQEEFILLLRKHGIRFEERDLWK